MGLLDKFKKNEPVNTPEYKGASFIPAKLKIVANKDGHAVFTETINIG